MQYLIKKRKIVHEYVHVLYNNYLSPMRILWLDEGLAQNLSKERENLSHNNYEKFRLLYNKFLNMLEFIEFDNLKHGNLFVNQYVNWYDISYLLVFYLINSNSRNEIVQLVKNPNNAKLLEKNIIRDTEIFLQKFLLTKT